MPSKAATVDQYLAELPEDRREALQAVRSVILKNLPKGFEEGMQYGMIGYYVPHSVYPAGYHCDPNQPLPFAGLTSQKNHMSISLFCIYCDPEEASAFQEAWIKSGKKLDMGKGCVRFKKLADVPLDVVGRTIKGINVKTFIAAYEAMRDGAGKRPKAAKAKKTATGKKSTAAKAKTAADPRWRGTTARNR